MERTCIYCKQTKPVATRFRGRDHVVPVAFGSFERAPTLDCVCDECNHILGRELEQPMARESGVGLLRYVFGLRPGTDLRNFQAGSVQVTLDGGLWHGVRVQLSYESQRGDIVIIPQGPQVGFKRRGRDGYEFFLMGELNDSLRHRADLDIEARPLVFLPDSARDEMLRRLEAVGIHKEYEREVAGPGTPGELISVEMSSQINTRLRRAVAKIAFNYLAWIHGCGFATEAMFDDIRTFVREGRNPSFPMVAVSMEPILADDTRVERQTNGHIVKINLNVTGLVLAGWVSLFNGPTYSVVLARPFRGVYRPDLRRGHLFDWEGGRIQELTAVSSTIALPPSLLRNRIT